MKRKFHIEGRNNFLIFCSLQIAKKEFFTWRKPLNTAVKLKLTLNPYRDVIFAHGDNIGIEKVKLISSSAVKKPPPTGNLFTRLLISMILDFSMLY